VRNILAIAVVAVALCTDRSAFASTSQHRAQHPTLAGQIVRKLQVSFRRIVTRVLPIEARVFRGSPLVYIPRPILALDVVPIRLSPFEFRLPPPSMS
jgi:hypothetical protein